MARSSTKAPAKAGVKILTTDWGRDIEVPTSTIIGKNYVIPGNSFTIGENCKIGNDVTLKTELGSNITIGNDCVIEAGHIRDDVTIGSDVIIMERCQIEKGVVIGNNTTIKMHVVIRPGVVIPDNWLIPEGAIVNPGPGGSPVVIVPVPTFKCNVNGQISTGNRGW